MPPQLRSKRGAVDETPPPSSAQYTNSSSNLKRQSDASQIHNPSKKAKIARNNREEVAVEVVPDSQSTPERDVDTQTVVYDTIHVDTSPYQKAEKSPAEVSDDLVASKLDARVPDSGERTSPKPVKETPKDRENLDHAQGHIEGRAEENPRKNVDTTSTEEAVGEHYPGENKSFSLEKVASALTAVPEKEPVTIEHADQSLEGASINGSLPSRKRVSEDVDEKFTKGTSGATSLQDAERYAADHHPTSNISQKNGTNGYSHSESDSESDSDAPEAITHAAAASQAKLSVAKVRQELALAKSTAKAKRRERDAKMLEERSASKRTPKVSLQQERKTGLSEDDIADVLVPSSPAQEDLKPTPQRPAKDFVLPDLLPEELLNAASDEDDDDSSAALPLSAPRVKTAQRLGEVERRAALARREKAAAKDRQQGKTVIRVLEARNPLLAPRAEARGNRVSREGLLRRARERSGAQGGGKLVLREIRRGFAYT